MKANYELCLSGSSCIFVPYRPEHLPNYHEWMQDPDLLEATASEPLSMEEEIQMQQEWRDDEKKCTFIILARDLIDEGKSDVPPPTTETESERSDEKKSYPQLVDETLDAMIGDVNLFLSEEELDESDDEQTTQREQPMPKLSQAELDLMIADPSHRHKNLGTELALMMMHYGATQLQIRRFFVKIKDTNHASLKLFKEKLGFVQCAYVECFGEYELECRCDTSEQMRVWVEKRWQLWCNQINKNTCDKDENWGEPCCRIYDVHSCPLNSS